MAVLVTRGAFRLRLGPGAKVLRRTKEFVGGAIGRGLLGASTFGNCSGIELPVDSTCSRLQHSEFPRMRECWISESLR